MKVRRLAKRRAARDFHSYAWWFHREVRAALAEADDLATRLIPHAEAMAKLEAAVRRPR